MFEALFHHGYDWYFSCFFHCFIGFPMHHKIMLKVSMRACTGADLRGSAHFNPPNSWNYSMTRSGCAWPCRWLELHS